MLKLCANRSETSQYATRSRIPGTRQKRSGLRAKSLGGEAVPFAFSSGVPYLAGRRRSRGRFHWSLEKTAKRRNSEKRSRRRRRAADRGRARRGDFFSVAATEVVAEEAPPFSGSAAGHCRLIRFMSINNLGDLRRAGALRLSSSIPSTAFFVFINIVNKIKEIK